jgi:predicted membrane-bound spermidine synthase
MGGLGAGAILLGARVDKQSRPLRFYAQLELLIAVTAALSPLLLRLARAAYLMSGGAESIGTVGAVILRLVLAAVVLGPPTFLMGGTLPAAARAIETSSDFGRRKLALLYGTNTLGAVVGVFVSTFYLLEQFGNRLTLWLAAAVNLLVAMAAFALAASWREREILPDAEGVRTTPNESGPLRLVLIGAWLSGFIFLLMELVWYRMMTPLLGGTTFSFGLILAIALFGVGIGSTVYACLGEQSRPTLNTFALTCAGEALFLAAPYALGDRIAVLALLLRPLGAIGFHGYVLSWLALTAIVVLPASIMAGLQFPILIALLGPGKRNVGRDAGLAYACNTLGAITGALAGGFGLLPGISAPGAWKFCVLLLATFGAFVSIVHWKCRSHRFFSLTSPVGFAICALLALVARGPTAAWRQSAIGAGRADQQFIHSANTKEAWIRNIREYSVFQKDGIESCLGISTFRDTAFLINGKSDGAAVGDAGTQIMIGLLGAALHPGVTRSLVIGLGTGSTAGWLAELPTMERVDVLELEPAVVKVAKLCAPVNRNALSNPKVRLIFGDAREKLLAGREQYDLIVSEPSNPYRAGIASLYTQEYYQAAARRLRPGGLFLQFMQAYEVDAATIRSIYKTLVSVFPVVETWQTLRTDLAFVCGEEPIRYDLEGLGKTLSVAPLPDALAKAWRVTDNEGFFAHYLGNASFAKDMANLPKTVLNTDDRNFAEFSFARTVGTNTGFYVGMLRNTAHRRHQDRPELANGQIDWENVDDQNMEMELTLNRPRSLVYDFLNTNQRQRVEAQTAYTDDQAAKALELWRAQPREASNLTEWMMIADLLAQKGDEDASKYIEKFAVLNPTGASLLRGILRGNQKRFDEAATFLESGYVSCRTDPWPAEVVLHHTFPVAVYVASRDKALALRLYHALEKPFAVNLAEDERRKALAYVGSVLDHDGYSDYTRNVIATFEPEVPWERDFLQTRRDCYRALSDPRATEAARDLDRFLAAEPAPLEPEK